MQKKCSHNKTKPLTVRQRKSSGFSCLWWLVRRFHGCAGAGGAGGLPTLRGALGLGADGVELRGRGTNR